jgi:hypothetical protein
MAFEANRNVQITVQVDTADATTKIARLNQQLEQLSRINLAGTSGLASAFDQLNRSISSGLVPGLSRARNELVPFRDGLNELRLGIITLDSAVNLLSRTFGVVQQAIAAAFGALLEAQQLEGLQRGFENLQGSVGQFTDSSLRSLREATRGLVSDFDLFRSANQAVLLGVDDGTGSFSKLAEAATRLGLAMGRTATESIADLVQGIGRQSRLILDNLGIVVRAEDAYKRYAATIRKSTDDLTQNEKQEAFRNAAIKAVTESAERLAAIQETAGVAATRLAATFENQRATFLTTFSASEELRDSFETLGAVLRSVNTAQLAADLAAITSVLVNLVSVGIKPVIKAIEILANRLTSLGAIDISKLFISPGAFIADQVADEVLNGADRAAARLAEQLQSTLENAVKSISDSGLLAGEELARPELIALGDQLEAANKALTEGLKVGIAATNEQRAALDLAQAALIAYGVETRAATKANDALEKGISKVDKALERQAQRTQEAIESLARSRFGQANPFVTQVENITAESFLLNETQEEFKVRLETVRRSLGGNKDALKEFEQAVKEVENSTGKLVEGKLKDAEDILKGLADSLKDGEITFQDFEEGLREIGEAAGLSSEQLLDLQKAILKARETANDLVRKQNEEFFSEISKGLFDALSFSITEALNKGIEKVGIRTLSLQLGEEFGNGLGLAASEAIKTALTQSLGAFAGPIGAFGGSLIGAITSKLFQDISKIGQGFEESVKGIATILGGAVGGPFGAIVGNLAGGFFEKNKEATRQARDNFLDFLTTAAEEADFESQLFGNLGTFSTEFFNLAETGLSEAEETINKLHIPPELEQDFLRLGDAFATVFDLGAEGISGFAGQLGHILAINLQDELGLNELQLLFEAAGISAEELGVQLEEAFFRGDLSAQQFLETTQATNDLFADGIPGAIGAVDAAFLNFQNTALESGQRAQDSITDLAFEFLETLPEGVDASTVSIDALEQALIAAGAPVDQVILLFDQLAAKGIQTVQQLAELDLTGTANLVVSLQNVGFEFQNIQTSIDATRTSLAQFRADAERRIVTNYEIRVSVTGDQVPSGATDPRARFSGQSANQ